MRKQSPPTPHDVEVCSSRLETRLWLHDLTVLGIVAPEQADEAVEALSARTPDPDRFLLLRIDLDADESAVRHAVTVHLDDAIDARQRTTPPAPSNVGGRPTKAPEADRPDYWRSVAVMEGMWDEVLAIDTVDAFVRLVAPRLWYLDPFVIESTEPVAGVMRLAMSAPKRLPIEFADAVRTVAPHVLNRRLITPLTCTKAIEAEFLGCDRETVNRRYGTKAPSK